MKRSGSPKTPAVEDFRIAPMARPFEAYALLAAWSEPETHCWRHGSGEVRRNVQDWMTVKSEGAVPITDVSKRSWRLVPTPGRLTTIGIPKDWSSAWGPIHSTSTTEGH